MLNKTTNHKKSKQSLQFNVAQFLKSSSDGIPRIYELENIILPNIKGEMVLLVPLQGVVKLTKINQDILVTGTLKAKMQLNCVRCLTPVNKSTQMVLEETFSPSYDLSTGSELLPTPETDPATLINEQHILDLNEVIRQALHLSQPAQILCKEGCLGLCLHCGQDKNKNSCICADNQIDTRWAKLLAYKTS